MRPKCIVYCLAAICLIFGFNGIFVFEEVDAMIEAEGTGSCYTDAQLVLLKEKLISFREKSAPNFHCYFLSFLESFFCVLIF